MFETDSDLTRTLSFYLLDLYNGISEVPTSPNECCDVAVGCDLAIWNLLDGRVHGVEKGSGLIGARHISRVELKVFPIWAFLGVKLSLITGSPD